MTSLFITGASGFLGGALLDKLDPGRYDRITLLSRGPVTLPPHLDRADNVRHIRASIEDVGRYRESLDENTRIVHLAAVTGKAEPREYYQVNTEGTRELLDAAKAAGAGEFLFVSSIAVSFKERKGYVYADSKEQAENIIRESGLNYCILRPTIILGKNSPIWASFEKLAASSLIVLPGNGRVRIQPIYVSDIVDLLLDVVNTGEFKNEMFEVGGREVLTMDEFVSRIHAFMKNRKPRIVHLPLGFLVASLRLFEKVFPSLLPVNSGQFSSFRNDGTARDNALLQRHSGGMKDVAAMLPLLHGDMTDG